MTTKPPTGPGPANPEALARQLIDELGRVSEEILTQSATEPPPIPRLGQLILRRGNLLDALGKISLATLPESSQQAVQAMLISCRAMDERVEQNLSGLRTSLGEELQVLKAGQTLLDKYRVSERDTSGPHSQEA
ncbi:MAG TPA: hypothetical protein V6C52_08835 [Coleofasciculaceae cyanobacterium]|jgi:hypothetical protein